MDPTWIIELTNGENKSIVCSMIGIAGDGSLLCFMNTMNQQPVPIQGYAPGTWKSFAKSSLNLQ
jgi:hypothetical protein